VAIVGLVVVVVVVVVSIIIKASVKYYKNSKAEGSKGCRIRD